MSIDLPRGAGTALFAGGGAWLPPPFRGDEALVLSEPARVLAARETDEVPLLVGEVEAEQQQGNFVATYLSYEAGAAFGFTVQAPAAGAPPLAWAAVYPPSAATVVPRAAWQELLDELDTSAIQQALAGVTPTLSVDQTTYTAAIARVRDYIAAGDTYQINYTVRGRYECPVDPLDYFLALVVRQPVPYAAYLDIGEAQVLSLSPEMFLRRKGKLLESRPMKGTRPRGAAHAEDVAWAYELAETEKERAENLMIVDMVRNDLGRVCRTGSVRVPVLYAVEPYRTVWQMTSTVTGEVHPSCSLCDIMASVFPGASITGAPKHHTMELIAELESGPRGIYTGTVALFLPGGDFTSNIAIRTITHRQGMCVLGTGSGIVWDAEAGAEYEETLTKAAFALPPGDDSWRPRRAPRLDPRVHGEDGVRLFETILLTPRDWDATVEAPPGTVALSSSLSISDGAILARYLYLDDHLKRMAASAAALGLPFDRDLLTQLLVGQGCLNPQALIVRVDLGVDGRFSLSTREVPPPAGPQPRGPQAAGAWAAGPQATGPQAAGESLALLVSPFRTDPDDPLLRHKTGVRGFYNREHRRALQAGCFDALFVNRLDRLTEGAITNLFARFGDRWVTPPVEDGLLPGIWRAHFRAEKNAEEASLTLEDLAEADEIVVGNSVRGAIAIGRLVADPLAY